MALHSNLVCVPVELYTLLMMAASGELEPTTLRPIVPDRTCIPRYGAERRPLQDAPQSSVGSRERASTTSHPMRKPSGKSSTSAPAPHRQGVASSTSESRSTCRLPRQSEPPHLVQAFARTRPPRLRLPHGPGPHSRAPRDVFFAPPAGSRRSAVKEAGEALEVLFASSPGSLCFGALHADTFAFCRAFQRRCRLRRRTEGHFITNREADVGFARACGDARPHVLALVPLSVLEPKQQGKKSEHVAE